MITRHQRVRLINRLQKILADFEGQALEGIADELHRIPPAHDSRQKADAIRMAIADLRAFNDAEFVRQKERSTRPLTKTPGPKW